MTSKPSPLYFSRATAVLAGTIAIVSAFPDNTASAAVGGEGNAAGASDSPTGETHLRKHGRRRHKLHHETITVASIGRLPAQPEGSAVPAPAARLAPVSGGGITVIVNGEAVTDLDHAPVLRSGSMLIPLNGILDRMAATVAWQSNTGTVDIQRGATHLRLVVGSPEARVNGTLQEMDAAPEVIGGTIFVPLRFIANSLGLQTDWNHTTRQLTLDSAAVPSPRSHGSDIGAGTGGNIVVPGPLPPDVSGTSTPHVPDLPTIPVPPVNPHPTTPTPVPSTLPPGPIISIDTPTAPQNNGGADIPAAGVAQPSQVHGQLASINKVESSSYISIALAGQGTRLRLAPNAIILARSADRLARQEVAIDSIYPGDDVTLHTDVQGEVTLVEVSYRLVRDQLQAIAGDKLLLASGQVVAAASGVSVILPTGAAGDLRQLRRGDMMALRMNPGTNLVWRIDARPGAGEIVPDSSTVHINTVAVEKNGPFLAGESLVGTMQGTSGGTAWLTIPGMEGRIDMKEDRPGEYTGQMIVPPGLSISNSPVVAHLTRNDETAHPLQAPGTVTIDSTPPAVKEMTPAAGSTVMNHQGPIYALLDDMGGAGIDPSSAKMSVNGLDVSDHLQVTDRFLTCTGLSLPDGPIRVVLKVKDNAGNFSVVPWQFNEESVGSQIHTVTLKQSHTRGGERIAVVLEGATQGDASFDLGSGVKNQSMREVRPGRYEGTLFLQKGEELVNVPVTGHLKIGEKGYSRLSSDCVTYVEGRPNIPVIDGPIIGSRIDNPLVVFGHADPGMRVRVKVEYENRVYAIFGMRGFSSEQDAIADDRGIWRTNPVGLSTQIPGAHHVSYRISCEAVNAGGHSSKSTHINVFRDMP